MSKSNVIIKSGLWYTVSNFLSKGILFLATPIFTRLLTKEEFGSFSNFSSWLNLLVIIVTLNVEVSLISARYDYEKTLDNFVFSALSLSSLSTLIWAVVCNIFMAPISAFLKLDPVYINCMFVYLLFFPALQLFQAQERFLFRYKVSATLSLLTTVGSCALSLALMFMMRDRLSGRIFGHVIPTALIGLGLYALLAVRGKGIHCSTWKYTLRVCLPYIPHLLSMTVLNSTDRIMITQLRGDEETALYSVAYSVAMIVTLLVTALNGAFSPWLAQQLAKEDYGSIRKVSKIYIALFGVFALGLMLMAPEVLLIMGGKGYMSAKPIMIPVMIGCICQFLYTMFVNVEQFYKKTIGMAIASVSAAALNYVLNLWLIPRFGYVAAAYTTLVGYLWLLFIHMWLVRRLKKQQVYSYGFVFLALAVVAVLAVVIALLYQSNIARYACVVVYGAVLLGAAWKYRAKIRELLRK
ncbi:MAG: oligosaccharide flippase family protein [Clostridia bacterium]|nr:oligosaccharide flippase family protein [Clostridia bacterium]